MTKAEVSALQRDLNRFTNRYLKDVPPLAVDGDRGHATNRRIQTAKFYLGYTGKSQRSSRLTPRFRDRLDHPKSDKFAPKAMLKRAEDRRREQREHATAPPSNPKEVIDRVVIPIARRCGINVTPESVAAANARHGHTVTGNVSDHEGPPDHAWAADMSNGSSPTPQMDELAHELAEHFNLGWAGFGIVNGYGGGYRYQMLYRTTIGGNHFNHVHFGVRRV